MIYLFILTVILCLHHGVHGSAHFSIDPECSDAEPGCFGWVARNHSSACASDEDVQRNCRRSCHLCGPEEIEPKFDLRNVPPKLTPVAFLIGKWRSEFGGKAFFPTIPKFTYGEQIEFSISDVVEGRLPTLNYTAFAWDPNKDEELHAENGYLVVNHTDPESLPEVELTTAMSNGFMTVEQGEVLESNQISFRLRRIGRISFSHDSAVRVMYREWTLLDPYHLEARLRMATPIIKLMEHTAIVYKRIYP